MRRGQANLRLETPGDDFLEEPEVIFQMQQQHVFRSGKEDSPSKIQAWNTAILTIRQPQDFVEDTE